MASIYKRTPTATNWMAQWHEWKDGKWHQTAGSTGTPDKASATAIANQRQVEANLAAARAGVEGKPFVIDALATSPETIAKARIASTIKSRGLRSTMEFATRIMIDQSPGTAKDYLLIIRRLDQFAGGHSTIDQITPELIEDWRDNLSQSYGANRVNYHLTVAGLLMRKAVAYGYAAADPTAVVDKVRKDPEADDIPLQPFSRPQVIALALAGYRIEMAGRHRQSDKWIPGMAREWEMAIRLMAVMGLRRGDCFTLESRQWDVRDRTLTYAAAKTARFGRKQIAFPLYLWPVESELLEDFLPPGGKLFPLIASQNSNWPSKAFARLLRYAEIDNPIQATGARTRRTFGLHSFRTTAITNAAEMGIPIEIRRALFGHASDRMAEQYTAWDDRRLRTAIRSYQDSLNSEKS